MRTVFLGTSEFAAAVLERLAAGSHRPALVLTRPDRPRGRGRALSAPPVAGTARELSLALWQPERVNDEETVARIAEAQPQAIVVCAFGALIREPLLSAHELLNVHPSLLPRWRGAAPIERAIMAGDRETGVSIMRLEAGLDSGPVCLARAVAMAPEDTYGSLAGRLQVLAGELIEEVLELIDDGGVPEWVAQDEAAATYAAKIEAADRLLDPALEAVELERRARGLTPHIGARVALADGSFLGVLGAVLARAEDLGAGAAGDPGAPGTGSGAPGTGSGAGEAGEISHRRPGSAVRTGLEARAERLLLHCRGGTLELLEVQPPGGRPMTAAAYIRGHRPAFG